MKFSTREDIDAPADEVFAALTDFDMIERQALRRGIEIERLDRLDGPAAGLSWRAEGLFRGRRRELVCTITRFDPASGLDVSGQSGGLEIAGTAELIPLSRRKTRLVTKLELTPTTFQSRLLLQSLRLAKSSLNRRFRARVEGFARRIDARAA